MTLEEAYKKHKQLLWRIAWSWNKTTGIDPKELHSEACYAFCKAWSYYTKKRGSETTYITRTVQNHLCRYFQLKKRFDEREFIPEINYSPDKFINLYKMISDLRKEAKDIVLILLNSPAEILGIDKSINQRKMQKKVREYLRKNNSNLKVNWIMNEIKRAVLKHL